MLEDAAEIRRVVLACGTVDLRKGIDGLRQWSSGTNISRTHLRKEPSSYSVGNVRIDVRDSCGWGQASCSSISGLRTGVCRGREIQNKPRN